MRTETDFLGEIQIPSNALYGINSARARENFPDNTKFHKEWYVAVASVKRACYETAIDFFEKIKKNYTIETLPIKLPSKEILSKLVESACECENGKHFDHFIIPAISGGAGTSINMNVNEILVNLSLQKLNDKAGNYEHVDPVEDANLFQSTNDVVPTALRLAAMQLLNKLEDEINLNRAGMENLEKKYRNSLRIGYTQMQEAVPTTFGRLFSSYNDTLSRDWWRISKCSERIKVVNLGGSAIGTSITVPRYFANEVIKTLQQITKLPITRGENLSDATSNLDTFVEVHAILKAHAVNLEKIVSDLRLLSSDMNNSSGLSIPKKQIGSSIMPGKVNPVIPEFIISSAHKIYANDQLISSLSAQGCLELNAYLPTIGHALLDSIKLLIACNNSCTDHLLNGLEINTELASKKLFESPSITTALIPYIGYNKSSILAKEMQDKNQDIYAANKHLSLISPNKLIQILKPENLMQGGYRIKDIEKI